jgi:hypothetical protein
VHGVAGVAAASLVGTGNPGSENKPNTRTGPPAETNDQPVNGTRIIST